MNQLQFWSIVHWTNRISKLRTKNLFTGLEAAYLQIAAQTKVALRSMNKKIQMTSTEKG